MKNSFIIEFTLNMVCLKKIILLFLFFTISITTSHAIVIGGDIKITEKAIENYLDSAKNNTILQPSISIQIFKKCIIYLDQQNKEKQLAETYNDIGIAYDNISDDGNSLKYYVKAIALCNKNGYVNLASKIQNNIGLIYLHKKMYVKAFNHLMKAEGFAEKNSIRLANILVNKGIVYNGMEILDSSFVMYQKAFKIAEKLKDTTLIIKTKINIGLHFYQKLEYKKAQGFFEFALSMAKLRSNVRLQALSHLNLAYIYYGTDQLDLVKHHLNRTLLLLSKSEVLRYKKDVYELFAEIYLKEKNYKQRSKYLTLYHQINDSIHNKETDKLFLNAQVQYETRKKEQENLLLKEKNKVVEANFLKERNRNLFLVVTLFLVLMIMTLFYIQKNKLSRTYHHLIDKNLEIIASQEELKEIKINSKRKVNLTNVNSSNKNKYSGSTLDEDAKEEIIQKIYFAMVKDKLYMNKELSLKIFSEAIAVNRNHVSQIINEKYKKNFNSLINEYRIKEAMRLLSEPESKLYTFEAIAFQVGFSSKTSFYRSFKAISGVTPSYFIKHL